MNIIEGYTLNEALRRQYKKPRRHKLPEGWRWLKIGEFTRVGDVACDDRIPPVKIIEGGATFQEDMHPIRRKNAEPF